MSNEKDGPIPHVEVADAATAFHKLENFTRKILAVPKRGTDDRLAKERTKKKPNR